MRKGIAISMVGGLLVAGPALAAEIISPKTGSNVPDPNLVNQVLNLSSSEVVTLDVPDTPGEAIMVTVPIAGVEYTLDLRPQSVRAASYQLLVQIDDGSMIQTQPGIVRTLRGSLAEVPGSIVAGSLLESGLMARIVFPDDSGSYWIERLAGHFPDVDEDLYVVYHQDDTLPSAGRCGVEDSIRIEDHNHDGPASGRGAACGTGLCTAELGIDADFDYFQDQGSSVPNTEAQIESVINTMNVQYETETDITHLITAIIVRSSEPDPYSSFNAFTLLDQFVAEWQNNQGGIPHDAAQLFTGKNLGGIIGVAYVGQVCLSFDYSLVQSDFDPNFACKTDLSAHELGHLWNADHCSCPNNTMNESITCANDFHDTLTVPVITAFRDSRTCLDGGGGGGDNNNCAEATDISDGTTSFSTIGATTDGPGLPSSCEEGFGLTLVNDIWFHYQASCTGTVTVSTCGTANYDTRLAAYEGTTCPPNNFVACNDDSVGCSGFTSIMEFEAVGGTIYKLRIGGFDGSGTGTVTISCDGEIATEACCFDSGDCADVDPATCAGAGGDSQGAGTDCAGVECAGATEACCFAGGACTELDASTCDSLGGASQGAGTDCASVDCATTEACCFDGGLCADLDVLACSGAGGASQGAGTNCAGTDCPGGVDNDDCADAFDIFDGSSSFSTMGATTDGPPLPPECDEGFGLSMVNDIWYHYTATCTGSALFTTCNTADFDTRLAAYEGTACPPSDLVGCNDDGDACGGFTSLLQFDVNQGIIYKLRIGGFDGSGSGSVVVACLPSPQDCEGDANGDGTVDPLDS
ncbi:MAG: hypothetical protein IID37_16975, partial [Planctomycetes bacterium]|nr:hypothetical protein [Planctomycetota bacterium]